MSNAKKQNIIARYFSDFGLRQICDILMIIGAITLIVGLFISLASVSVSITVLTVGLCIYIVASVLALVRTVTVLCSKINHRSPDYKRAIVNTVIMAVIFALSVFGLIYVLVFL